MSASRKTTRQSKSPAAKARVQKQSIKEIRPFMSPEQIAIALYQNIVDDDEMRRNCHDFITACLRLSLHKLKDEAHPSGSYLLMEILQQTTRAIEKLIRGGDIWIFRDLAPILESLEASGGATSRKVWRGTGKQGITAREVLQKTKPANVLRNLKGLYEGGSDRPYLDQTEYERLRGLNEPELATQLESEHAAAIENMFEGKGGWGRRNINFFALSLAHGWFWNGGPPVKCAWHGTHSLPSDTVVQAYLIEKTGGDATKLNVFKYMLARRRATFAGETLADDKSGYAWNQVMTRLREAWVTLGIRKRPARQRQRRGAES